MSETVKAKIIKSLVETQGIEKQVLNDAAQTAKTRGVGLEQVLIEQELINEQDLLLLLVKELNIPFINLGKYKLDPALQEVVTEKIARKYKIIPLAVLEFSITIAVSDPLNVFMIDDLKNITGKEVDIVMSTSSQILKTIDQFYGTESMNTVTEITKDIEMESFEIVSEDEEDVDIDTSVDESEKAPIIRMVNLIIKDAIQQRASDIHIEPTAGDMRVRFRIDGVLVNILDIPKENQNAIIVRIKIMSRLDITIAQLPQDGRFKLKIQKKEVDFRVSLLPTTFGQKIVMRVLDKKNLAVGINGLGLTERNLELLKDGITKPFGMLLVTGPTGSGKSTTLYSLISELNSVDRNIITIEDPVEYLIEGLSQIQARPDIGLTFAEGLRAVLRQSPDIVMVGEIRDNETADIAIKASLTGQLVFSTLHTNDAPGALTRLVDMKVEPFLVASSLVLVTAQRLCRRLCTKCRKEISSPTELLKKLNYTPGKDIKFYEGPGCSACRNTGYQGRMCVTEILDVDDDVRYMLLEGKSSDDLKEFAIKEKGMTTLFMDAMEKCVSGQTTLEEVLRVTTNE